MADDAVAALERGDFSANFEDFACGIRKRRERQRQARSEMALDEREVALVERPGAPSHKHVAWTRRRFGHISKRKTIDAEASELILFHVRWDLLPAHLLVPALGFRTFSFEGF